MYYIVKSWSKAFGGKGYQVAPHEFRASYINYLLEAGADISIVADLAGHADVKTTKIYDRCGKKSLKKAVDLIKIR